MRIEGRGYALFPVKIFQTKFSQQNTEVYVKGWCEIVSREMQRRVRVQCHGGAQTLPMREEPGKSAKVSAAYGPEIN